MGDYPALVVISERNDCLSSSLGQASSDSSILPDHREPRGGASEPIMSHMLPALRSSGDGAHVARGALDFFSMSDDNDDLW